MFKNERILRPEFYLAKPWTYNNSAVLFTFLGYASPFKGLHVLIESLRILKREFPDIKLYIAGSNQLEGLRRDGYLNFINNIIKRNDLTDNVIWLGPLSANEIIKYLYLSAVAVFPSFIESYGVALAESMMIGVPSVAAYNGGYSYLGNDHENVLFFPPGESSLCAFQINKILSDKNLTIKLSINSRLAALKRNDFNNVLKQQIHIYQEIPHLNTPHLQVQN
jgi:glycosyltransferase involved in cell wall biosynthesis